ncbi:glycosyltransferase family 2 protein [Thiogranum longum]
MHSTSDTATNINVKTFSLQNPVVSVVLPYRNAECTLDETLQSILGQRYTAFELLAINDHSSDGSEHILRGYQKHDSRLHMMASPARGIVAALNAGLETARGKLIARMDADDRMRPDRLEKQVAALEAHSDWSLVACQVNLFPEHLIRGGYRDYVRWQNRCLAPRDIEADIYLESPFAHPSVMFRKGDVLRLGGYRQGDFPEDYDLWLRMFHAGLTMAKLPEPLLDWRESRHRLSRCDPRYSQEAFDRLRARYLVRDPRLLGRRELVIWGAGRRTRQRCQYLLKQGFSPWAWIDIDPRKIGKSLSGIPVHEPHWLASQAEKPLVLVYVRNHGARDRIDGFLANAAYQRGRDYLFVG